jgi:hypothetical protein
MVGAVALLRVCEEGATLRGTVAAQLLIASDSYLRFLDNDELLRVQKKRVDSSRVSNESNMRDELTFLCCCSKQNVVTPDRSS